MFSSTTLLDLLEELRIFYIFYWLCLCLSGPGVKLCMTAVLLWICCLFVCKEKNSAYQHWHKEERARLYVIPNSAVIWWLFFMLHTGVAHDKTFVWNMVHEREEEERERGEREWGERGGEGRERGRLETTACCSPDHTFTRHAFPCWPIY